MVEGDGGQDAGAPCGEHPRIQAERCDEPVDRIGDQHHGKRQHDGPGDAAVLRLDESEDDQTQQQRPHP